MDGPLDSRYIIVVKNVTDDENLKNDKLVFILGLNPEIIAEMSWIVLGSMRVHHNSGALEIFIYLFEGGFQFDSE